MTVRKMETINALGTIEEYWVDTSGMNTWSTSKYSLEEATSMAETLIDCTDCYNCSDCRNCTSCIDCSDCEYCCDCTGCKSCHNCNRCINCTKCNRCDITKDSVNCELCTECVECTDCTTCDNCDTCNSCINCYNCYKCTECSECRTCTDCSGSIHCKRLKRKTDCFNMFSPVSYLEDMGIDFTEGYDEQVLLWLNYIECLECDDAEDLSKYFES